VPRSILLVNQEELITMFESRTQLRDLADRLVVEYADALPPGQVLATVYRTAQRVRGVPGLSHQIHQQSCEQSARRILSERATSRGARSRRPAAPGGRADLSAR
jgi:hypothetical protein